ncbi:condensation domain-containing protein [Serratia fonticola]
MQTVSDYEEHIWLLQQQDAGRVLKHISSWRLDDSTNIARLVNAIQTITEIIPDLNVRYELNGNGQLIKHSPPPWYSCVEFIYAASHRDILAQTLAQQASTWDLALHAPFRALIISCHGEVILSLLLHEILAPVGNEQQILDALQRAYYGDFIVVRPLKRIAQSPFDEQKVSPVPGLRRRQGENTVIFSSTSGEPAQDNGTLAMRWSTQVNISELQALPASESPSYDAMFAGISVRFTQFISQAQSKDSLALCLLQQDGTRHILLDAAAESTQLIKSVTDKLRSQPDQNDPTFCAAEEPWIYVRLLSPASNKTRTRALLRQPMLLPTYEIRPDIELTIAIQDGEDLTLILTTGQAIYPSAGELLLGQFVSHLRGDENFAAALPAGMSAGMVDTVTHNASKQGDATDVAAIILSEFRQALSAPAMTLTDDFFDYGGHSMLATRVIGRLISIHGLEVHFGDFFSYPSAATLAARAIPTHRQKDTVPAPQPNPSVTAPLALAQASLWKSYQAHEFGTIFNLPFALDFLDEVDETRLEQALFDLIARHPSLRTLFYSQNGKACQQVVDMVQLAGYKWFWYSHENINVTLRHEATYRFDLAHELPIRIRLLHAPETGRQVLSFLVHHMAIDEWSLNIMMEELSLAYSSRAANKTPVWKESALPFHEFALRQQAAGVNQQHLDYWTNMLRGSTYGLALPIPGHEPVSEANESSPQANWLTYRPQPEVTQQLYALARQNNASLFCILYAAIVLSLHKIGNLQDIVIGTSAPGRNDPQTHETVGYFTTMVAHRVQFARDKPVKTLIADIRDSITDSMPYADIPLDVIQQSLGMAPEEGPIFDVYIQIHANNALNGELNTPSGNAIRYRQIDTEKTESMFGLQFEIMEDVIKGEKSVRLVITYRTERYAEPLVKRINEVIDNILVFFTTSASLETPLAQVPM